MVPFVAPNGQNTMKKSLIALLAVCILLLVGAYVGVDLYTKRVDQQEQILLQQQQEAYALARTKRTGELRATLIDEELRSKLGIADQAGAGLASRSKSRRTVCSWALWNSRSLQIRPVGRKPAHADSGSSSMTTTRFGRVS